MIKSFKSFNEIKNICQKYNIRDYTINSDESIDVNGCVDLDHLNYDKLPLKFNYINGYFCCDGNKLKSLQGAPKEVTDSFYCENNHLTSLRVPRKKLVVHFHALLIN